MNEDKIKESFGKVKEDIYKMRIEIAELKKVCKEVSAEFRGQNTRKAYTQPADNLHINRGKFPQSAENSNLNKGLLIKTIANYITTGYQISEIKKEVIGEFNIKKTCFYKYLNLVRGILQTKQIDS